MTARYAAWQTELQPFEAVVRSAIDSIGIRPGSRFVLLNLGRRLLKLYRTTDRAALAAAWARACRHASSQGADERGVRSVRAVADRVLLAEGPMPTEEET